MPIHIYIISSGKFITVIDEKTFTVFSGYSGKGNAKNDVTRIAEKGVGPIPPGAYNLVSFGPHGKLGPGCIGIVPNGHDALGRSGFFIHGDNADHDASHGCIIIGGAANRQFIWDHAKNLLVTK